ncbi:Proton-coupled amino acid transporter [Nesidiocoris tenuis]|nr:Proton-coupled amino acid transporter [Nesidiocoris tenuis]
MIWFDHVLKPTQTAVNGKPVGFVVFGRRISANLDPTCSIRHEKNKNDVEESRASNWDPFAERRLRHPTTDNETLVHLLKASLGTGILAMPFAYENSGMASGVILTVLVYIICTHGSYVVVNCAHELYRRTRVTSMTFADVGEVAFAHGPSWGRRYAKLARISILGGLFLAYFGTCSVYAVIISENFRQVANQYVDYELNQRLCISTLLVPLIILSWIPDLKYLAPVSMVANVFMGLGLCITFSYLFDDLSSPFELPQFGRVYDLPQFFSITIFTMEVVGVVMPLENSMATPQNFTGVTGVLSRGMAIVTCVFISLGFMGYLKYKGDTKASITLNLPSDEYLAQSVKILIGLAVLCSYNLQFFICLEIVWNALKGKSKSSQVVFEYIVRTLLTAATVFLAVAVPTIGPFLALIGAFCFSFLGLMIPALIDTVTFWDRGFGRLNWAIWKNVGMFMFGLVALVSGSYTSIVDIVNEYGKNETVVAVPIHD